MNRSGKLVLRPRARIITSIGRELISNQVVALVELIKNAYDADSASAKVSFIGDLLPGKGSVVVEDDGVGMTLADIKNAWFEPATPSKLTRRKTRKGRRVTGAKGLGRFAAARIARKLEMTSVSRKTRRLVSVKFDWGKFDDKRLYLDQVKCEWKEEPVPHGRGPGTILKLELLNDSWEDPVAFQRLRGELSRLISPLSDPTSFNISLNLPDRFRDYSGDVTAPAIVSRPRYMFTGRIESDGSFTAQYQGPDVEGPLRMSERVLLDDDARIPTCGPFAFEFKVWDRDFAELEGIAKELNTKVGQLRKDLDSACGISVYRDHFRLLLADNDWLRLDSRRVQNPTMRLSNNQVVGAIHISADANPELQDQTNREGIVSNASSGDFSKTIVALLAKLETRRDTFRRGRRTEEAGEGIFQKLDLTPIRAYLEKRYPKDAELKSFLEDKSKTFDQGITEVRQVLARYRRLATLGQLIDKTLHEGRTPIAAISNEVDLGRRDLANMKDGTISPESVKKRYDVIYGQANVLSTLFRNLAPFSGRKRGHAEKTTIEALINNAFAIHQKQIQDLGIEVSPLNTVTTVTVDPAEIQEIFVNLLDNSLYWLSRTPVGGRKIHVEVSRSAEGIHVVFSDSGPGVSEEIRERIFDPYFSTKPDGVGLGLTIAGEAAAEHDGSLELVTGGPLSGATFRVILRKRIGEPSA